MAEDLTIGIGVQDGGSVKKMQEDLAKAEKAALATGNATEKTGKKAKEAGNSFFGLKENTKALLGNVSSMVGQWTVFAVAVAGTHGIMKAIREETERLKRGMEAVGETGLTKMSLKMLEESGQVEPGIIGKATGFSQRISGAGLQLKETDILRAAEILGPAAKERGVPIEQLLNAVVDVFLRSKGTKGPVEAAQSLIGMMRTGEVGDLARMGYVGIDTTEMEGMSIEERVAVTMQKLLPQMQGTQLLGRMMREDTSEAAAARLGLSNISRKNAEAEAEELLAEMNKGSLEAAQRYRQLYQNYYGIDPSSLSQMWLHGRIGDYLKFAEMNPEAAFMGPVMQTHNALGWFGRNLTPLGLLRSNELPMVKVQTTGGGSNE